MSLRDTPITEGLVALPLTWEGDVSMIEALLEGAGFWLLKEDGFGESSPRLFVRVEDIEAVKEFLSAYRVSQLRGPTTPIAW